MNQPQLEKSKHKSLQKIGVNHINNQYLRYQQRGIASSNAKQNISFGWRWQLKNSDLSSQ